MRYCEEGHFETDHSVLNGEGKIICGVFAGWRNGVKEEEDSEEETLPIWCEDDEFYCEKLKLGGFSGYRYLGDWTERFEVPVETYPEET